jgi:hypothetical protein
VSGVGGGRGATEPEERPKVAEVQRGRRDRREREEEDETMRKTWLQVPPIVHRKVLYSSIESKGLLQLGVGDICHGWRDPV